MIKITSGTVLKTSEHEEFIEQQYFPLKIKNLIKSQCSAQQSHLKVRCQKQEYFNLHDFTRKQMTKIRLNEIQTW